MRPFFVWEQIAVVGGFEDPAPSLGTEMVGQCILNAYFEDRDGGGKPPSDVQFGVR